MCYHVVKVELLFNCNAVYQIAYHVVWLVSQRSQGSFGRPRCGGFEALLEAICAERAWRILALEIPPDHVHLFVSLRLRRPFADAVKILKGATARLRFQSFPAIRQKLWNGCVVVPLLFRWRRWQRERRNHPPRYRADRTYPG